MTEPFHPVAAVFPLLDDAALNDLADDIRAHGLHEPIWRHDGLIVDGRNRWRACRLAGVEPRYREWDGRGSLVAFVVSLNLHRRHLTSSQRAMVALDAEHHLAQEARQRQRQAAARTNQQRWQPQQPESLAELIPQAIEDDEGGRARDEAAQLLGTNPRYVSDAKRLAAERPDLADQVRSGDLSIPEAKRTVAREQRDATFTAMAAEPAVPLPDRRYRGIVIDPPWPMQKIEREARPLQEQRLDYPTMRLDEIADLPVGDLTHEDGAHLYLWVTHKFLPAGLDLVERWGFRYQCVMTWRKNVGITPFSWMYDTEHVIFARTGSLDLMRKGLRLSFDAPVAGHSVKPDVFYDRVVEATPGPRLDMFARQPREGFDVWGNEVADAS